MSKKAISSSVLTFSLLLFSHTLIKAADDLPSTADQLAQVLDSPVKSLAKYISSQGGKIRIHKITPPPLCPEGADGLLRSALLIAFEKHKTTVSDGASLSLNLEVYLGADRKKFPEAQFKTTKAGKTPIFFSFKLIQASGLPIQIDVPTVDTTNPAILALLTGVNTSFQTLNRDRELRNNRKVAAQALTDFERKPDPPIEQMPEQQGGDAVVVGDYQVQLIVNDKPVKLLANRGKPYLPVPLNATYKIRFVNNDQKYDALIEVLIDGISMFHFAPKTKYSHLMIRRGKSFTIPGWYITDEGSKQFLVNNSNRFTDERRACLVDKGYSRGTIQIRVHQGWKEGETPPDGITLADSPGTDLGPDVLQKYEPVEREAGPVKATIAIVYAKQQD